VTRRGRTYETPASGIVSDALGRDAVQSRLG